MSDGFDRLKPRQLILLIQALRQSSTKDDKHLYRRMIVQGVTQWILWGFVILATVASLGFVANPTGWRLVLLPYYKKYTFSI